MKRLILGILLMAGSCTGLATYHPEADTTPPTTRCEEDMPCWDCSTMGNKICGIAD